MKDQINKSLEFKIEVKEVEYNVKALLISAPKDLEIKNIEMEENEGYIFNILLSIEPFSLRDIVDTSNELIFIVGENEMNRFGYLIDSFFQEIEDNSFIRLLKLNILEVLLIAGNTGHYKS